MASSSAPSSSFSSSAQLLLVLSLSLSALSLDPSTLLSLSSTSQAVRGVVFGVLFRVLKVERTLEENEEEEKVGVELDDSDSEELSEVKGAVRCLEWGLRGSQECDGDEEEEEGLGAWEARGARETETLGRLMRSCPRLTYLTLSSSSFHQSTSTPCSLAPAFLSPSSSPLAQLSNLSTLSLTGFSIPTDLLLRLLVSTPNLLELTLQTFSPAASSLSVLTGTNDELTNGPTPSPLPLSLPTSALQNLHTFTGLASHIKVLLSAGTRSLRSLTVEMCGFEGGWEELVRDLEDGLPYRDGRAGLVELRVLGIEVGGVEEGVSLVKRLGEGLKGKGGLEELELGWAEGLGEEEVGECLTKALPFLTTHFPSLRSLTLTTPEPSSAEPTNTPELPLLSLSLALTNLTTLTVNSTVWNFSRPPPEPTIDDESDPNALVRVPTNTTTTTRPALPHSASSASGSMALGLGGGLNNNKKVGRALKERERFRCEVEDALVSSSGEE
ncbi:hypothetical protein BDY24DRAFT_440499 [Mrakia frigida]|uniref:uncharacterized protein n=1 Tax=Mrakia frigida TaxID=29902 RepID=UPI003FCC08FC